jgi:hypothetical protein
MVGDELIHGIPPQRGRPDKETVVNNGTSGAQRRMRGNPAIARHLLGVVLAAEYGQGTVTLAPVAVNFLA